LWLRFRPLDFTGAILDLIEALALDLAAIATPQQVMARFF
jgi:hypothetical protein